MEINIKDLTWDTFIYPRGTKSDKTVRAYVDALAAGAEFPPINIQKVFNYTNGNGSIEATLILDGIHRMFAHRESGLKKIEAVEWTKKPLDYEKTKTVLLLESAGYNISHGDRLSPGDKKRIAREIASTDPEYKWKESAIAKKLGVTRQMVNNWIADIRAKQRSSRDTIIIRLSRLGWTQDDIGKVMGMSQNRISEIIGKANICDIDNLLSKGHDMEYIARHYNMDLPLAWALRLTGKTDQEKFKELGWGLRTWDQWDFKECDERFGDDWPGRIPAQLIAHTLFYFTTPGDLVLDPMAGGGVVSDVCLLFERKCQSFDMVTRENRPEIQYNYWGPLAGNWPIARRADLIFFDPPNFIKQEKTYSEIAAEEFPSTSSYPKERYEEFLKSFFKLTLKNTGKNSRIAFINADWRDFESTPASKEKSENSITMFNYHRLLSTAGWTVTHRIECPLSSEQLSENQEDRMQNKRILGTVGRTLLVAKKI